MFDKGLFLLDHLSYIAIYRKSLGEILSQTESIESSTT